MPEKNSRKQLNVYWRDYYAKNEEQIRQRVSVERQRKVSQNIVHLGAWDQESEILRYWKRVLFPANMRYTLWNTECQDLNVLNLQ